MKIKNPILIIVCSLVAGLLFQVGLSTIWVIGGVLAAMAIVDLLAKKIGWLNRKVAFRYHAMMYLGLLGTVVLLETFFN
ncbi:hypothetical protein [Mangrovibacillus cuniculi]|uniref:Uncharacterized protein n=1 Tax=Mangrovibacillus cuniculi TaxID=2593652 RepID=A0A7S8HEL7_9BACI|nr:hypothetical protein [Mangrovibacillus cuniculi]QPC45621.1 hypothetical protein G8O30_00825 [Mangrovibacillus cuniculi]